MDQDALQKLLKELQGLDQPGDEQDLPTAPLDPDAVAAKEPVQVAAAGNDVDDAGPEKRDDSLPSESELERLLGSLKPLEAVRTFDSHVANDTGYPYHDYSAPEAGYPDYSDQSGYPQTGNSALLDVAGPATDLRKLTYAQALPVISRLAGDPDFLDKLQEITSQQEAFELSILDERNKAKDALEKQMKAAQDKAKISGLNYEVDRVIKLLNSHNARFDKQALVRWDNLARTQQAQLENLGVPCFYVLKGPDAIAQERQRRVMETLITLLKDS